MTGVQTCALPICDKTSCYMDFKHLPFQCACNTNKTISFYALGNYDFYDVEQIEEFIAWKGAIEIDSMLKIKMMLLTNLKFVLY